MSNCCSNCGENKAMYCAKCLHAEKEKAKELKELVDDAKILIDMLCNEYRIEGNVRHDSIFTAKGILKRIEWLLEK